MPQEGPQGRFEVTPELVLQAYRAGLFPMSEARDDPRTFWLDPERRGVLPLENFHLPRRLARTILSDRFEVTSDRDFPAVIAACAAPAPGRAETWINREIEALFNALHLQGHAHSVECRMEGTLVGGLYGVAVGGAFFGESMFSRVRDASKVALAHVVARLRLNGFRLLDTQFVTAHLARFGARELPREAYHALLRRAVATPAGWRPAPSRAAVRDEIARLARAVETDRKPE